MTGTGDDDERAANTTAVTMDSPRPYDPGRAPNLEARQIVDRVGAALFGEFPRSTGRYDILGKLGAGGMGVVYVAHDPLLDCKVALKQLHPHLVVEHGFLDRLRTEARAMARLRSEPHVVTLYDFFVQDDVVFVVMELVEGSTLRAWQGRPRSWREVVAVYVQAGQGLAAAHRAGLTHRDFKPENVLIDGRGVAKVGDFGLARADRSRGKTLQDVGDPGLTRAGAVIGTPRYMAPEQLRGEAVDPRGDQFSFYFALQGKPCGTI
jgi:serine/threonine protein kinase